MKTAYNSAYVHLETFNFSILLRPASLYCVFLSLFQLPRYAIQSAKYYYFFANNVRLYINSHAANNQHATAVNIHWPIAITHISPNFPYLHANRDGRPKPNLCYATFARRLTKIAQTTQNKHTAGNDLSLPLRRRYLALNPAACCCYWHLRMKWLLHFCIFLATPTPISNLTVSSKSQWIVYSNNI